jgi:hypothetical protein
VLGEKDGLGDLELDVLGEDDGLGDLKSDGPWSQVVNLVMEL